MSDSLHGRVQYPNDWTKLKFKEKRFELLEFLKEVCEPPGFESSDKFDIDALVHFIFDDTDLGSKPESTIGLILFDQIESNVIKEFATRLGFMIDELGDAKTEEFLVSKKWSMVREQAVLAKSVLSTHGEPEFSN